MLVVYAALLQNTQLEALGKEYRTAVINVFATPKLLPVLLFVMFTYTYALSVCT